MTLRIKKVFFDRILSGEKTIEYREDKTFYRRLFNSGAPHSLTLHYQSPRRLIVEVKSVRLIRRPAHIQACQTPNVFAISLGRILSYIPGGR